MTTRKKFTKVKLEYYKKLLQKIKKDFLHDIDNMLHNPGSASEEMQGGAAGNVQHMADVATDMYDREFNLGLAANEREVLLRIETALKKIEDKSFGGCMECKKPIPEARLKAIPYGENCLKCQEKIEAEG